jgi:two-component system response regulator AtoC
LFYLFLKTRLMDNLSVRIALIDDDRVTTKRLQEALNQWGYSVDVFHDGESFFDSSAPSSCGLVITDLKMGKMNGLEVLRRVKAENEDVEVIVITGFGSIDTAIEAIRYGAFHYLTKPIRLVEFQNLVKRIIEKIVLQDEAENLRESMAQGARLAKMVGCSLEMNQVFRLIEKVAPLDCPVVIQGESGTGKELVAQAIHHLSPRRQRPMVSFNCGGFSNELIANELFGHAKGSYSGAFSSQKGMLEAADHGTVFLDEIAAMPMDMQIKLLRVLQDKQIYRIGSTQSIALDIRVLAASNKDLQKQVESGSFREDLYFRLNVITIALPRLVTRQGDLSLLINHFIHKFSQSYQKKMSGISKEAVTVLERYHFPGNVRELENIIARAVALSDGPQIELNQLPAFFHKDDSSESGQLGTLEDLEKEHLRRVLAQSQQRRTQAAKILGITRTTLWRKLKKYGLE